MLINGLGATATGITVLIVLAAKFVEGAWVTVLLIPLLLIFMMSVRRHYTEIQHEIELHTPLSLKHLEPPIVIVPLQGWTKIAEKGLRFAIHLSPDVLALQVRASDKTEDLRSSWGRLVEAPVLELGLPVPKLTVVDSPYRQVFRPILDFVNEVAQKNPDRDVAVLIPELVERHWFHYFLHNQRAVVLKALLFVKGNQRLSVINVPWYLTT
jgi:hypothetical protein